MKHDDKQTTYTKLEQVTVIAPNIKISKNAIKWLTLLAEMHDHEIGVFGCVDEIAENSYLIRDIFYPKHCEANGATCEISPEGETLMAEWLISHNREADLAKVKFWGHSHHTMDVFASGQDESQALERMTRTQSYFIRGIFNKEGKLSISFFDYTRKIKFDHIKWEVEFPVDDEEKIIRDKIEELKKTNLPAIKSYPYTPTSIIQSQFNQKDEFWDKKNSVHGREFINDFNHRNNKKNKNRRNGKEMSFEFEKQNQFSNMTEGCY